MKARIVLSASAALIVIAMVACGGTSSVSSGTSTASSGPNAGPPPSSSNPGGSASGSASDGSGSGSNSGGAGASGSAQSAIAYVYVGTTGNGTAGIHGFAIAPDGTTASVPQSPAGGPSSYVVTNSAFVFASDGTNIASYARSSDGSLEQSSVSPGTGLQPSLIQAMSLDHTGQTLYAMGNAGSDDVYYLIFSIASNGKVTSLATLGPNVDYTSPLVFSPDNQYAYGHGCFHADFDITGFRRNSDGTLTRLSPDATNNAGGVPAYAAPWGAQIYCPEGEAVSQNGYLAVAVTQNGTNTSGLGSYKIGSDGSLSFVQNSTVATQLPRIQGMNFDRSGRFLAAAGNGGIQIYELTSAGTFTAIGGVQQPGPTYLAVEWDADNHLYATSNSGLYVFTNANGVLTPVAGSPHAAGAAATLAVLPTH
jgi:6-phosphogluconolactonase (cycloisomerase 2 family)